MKPNKLHSNIYLAFIPVNSKLLVLLLVQLVYINSIMNYLNVWKVH